MEAEQVFKIDQFYTPKNTQSLLVKLYPSHF